MSQIFTQRIADALAALSDLRMAGQISLADDLVIRRAIGAGFCVTPAAAGADVSRQGMNALAPRARRVPSRYVPAIWRDMTPIDPDTLEIGIGFSTPQGEVFLRLSEQSVSNIVEAVTAYRADLAETKVQSRSEGDGDRSVVRNPDEMLK